MKDWSPDHPKAKLMARKRSAILDAARRCFLESGYEGTSMEHIAAAADVSIMTLYRHAESKDDLFAAVVANACDPDDEAEQAEMAALLQQPLRDILAGSGVWMQQKLTDIETVALMRTVMAEASRFPHLAEMAYRSLIGHFVGFTEHILAGKPESAGIGQAERARLAARFVDRLVGADLLRVLLGLDGIGVGDQTARAAEATESLLAALAAMKAAPDPHMVAG